MLHTLSIPKHEKSVHIIITEIISMDKTKKKNSFQPKQKPRHKLFNTSTKNSKTDDERSQLVTELIKETTKVLHVILKHQILILWNIQEPFCLSVERFDDFHLD